MSQDDGFRKYLDAAESLAQVTRDRAEEFVRELMAIGEEEHDEAHDWVNDLVDRSRKASDALMDIVRSEISTQLGLLGIDSLEDMADRVADILRRSGDLGKVASSTLIDAKAKTAERVATATAAAKKAATKKAPATKTAATKTAATKTAATKAPAKKTATKKTAAKKTATKKTAAKKAATKTAAKKAPATKAPATKAPATKAPASPGPTSPGR